MESLENKSNKLKNLVDKFESKNNSEEELSNVKIKKIKSLIVYD